VVLLLRVRIFCGTAYKRFSATRRITTHRHGHELIKVWFTYPVHVIGIWHAKPLVKAMPGWHSVWRITKMPLAENTGSITTLLQRFCHGYLGLWHAARLIREVNSNVATI
jgi:hypothetical protein